MLECLTDALAPKPPDRVPGAFLSRIGGLIDRTSDLLACHFMEVQRLSRHDSSRHMSMAPPLESAA
jgi:hypothetical protein